MKYLYSLVFIFIVIYIAGCGFDDPYVPDSVGSSTLKGRIVTEPVTDITGTEIHLRGSSSFAVLTDSAGNFSFKDIPPGNYIVHLQKSPYLLDSFPVNVKKANEEIIDDIKVKLHGAIAGVIPSDKISILQGEVEIVVYVNGIPNIPQRDQNGDFFIDLSSPDSIITIRTVTKTTVYIDDTVYTAKVMDDGNFIVEFVPPGIYNDIKVKLNSKEDTLTLVSNGTIEVKSGQTRTLPVPTTASKSLIKDSL